MPDQMTPRTVPVNGTTLTYVERGVGEPLIFVHGSQGDYRTWLAQLELFSQGFRAIAYSRRYHYPNPWVGEGTDYTVGLHADDLIGLIETLGLAPVNVVGNSFGAYTTLVAATRRPDLLRKIVVGEPPILPWLKMIPGGQVYWDGFMSNAWQPATEAFRRGDLVAGTRAFLDGVLGSPGAFDHVPQPARQRMMDNARALAAETASPGYFTEITPGQVSQIPLPMLLLKGEQSAMMFHLIVDRLAECAPSARVATVPNAGHSMYTGNPQGYYAVVRQFLMG